MKNLLSDRAEYPREDTRSGDGYEKGGDGNYIICILFCIMLLFMHGRKRSNISKKLSLRKHREHRKDQ
jgi:hypothetical protein